MADEYRLICVNDESNQFYPTHTYGFYTTVQNIFTLGYGGGYQDITQNPYFKGMYKIPYKSTYPGFSGELDTYAILFYPKNFKGISDVGAFLDTTQQRVPDGNSVVIGGETYTQYEVMKSMDAKQKGFLLVRPIICVVVGISGSPDLNADYLTFNPTVEVDNVWDSILLGIFDVEYSNMNAFNKSVKLSSNNIKWELARQPQSSADFTKLVDEVSFPITFGFSGEKQLRDDLAQTNDIVYNSQHPLTRKVVNKDGSGIGSVMFGLSPETDNSIIQGETVDTSKLTQGYPVSLRLSAFNGGNYGITFTDSFIVPNSQTEFPMSTGLHTISMNGIGNVSSGDWYTNIFIECYTLTETMTEV